MAFLQSGPPRQPVFRAPAVVITLIAALAAAHAAREALGPPASESLVNQYALIPARYSHAFLTSYHIDPGSLVERVAPFFTYMALHNDWTHLLINSVWLLAFGPVVARRFGTLLFLVFFIMCGLAAAATYLAFHWAEPVPVIGASGAISGLMGAALRMLQGQAPLWVQAGTPEQAPLAPIFSRSLLMFSAVWAVINVVAGVTGLGSGGEGAIAWEAHLGGYVAGLLLAGPFDFLRPRPTSVLV